MRARWPVAAAAGPTDVDGDEEGEAEIGRSEERFHETTAKDRPPAAAATRAPPRKKRDMTGGASGGEAVGVGDLCVLGSTSACADLGLLATERFFFDTVPLVCSQHVHIHPYEYTYANFTLMSTFEELSTGIPGDSFT
jgi:hypothetical protein